MSTNLNILQLTLEEATGFFSEFYNGEHNIPSKIKEFGFGWCVVVYGRLSTFDSDGLTRLVIMAHSYHYRVELSSAGSGKIRISIHKRLPEGTISQRHPSLFDLVEIIQTRIGKDLPF